MLTLPADYVWLKPRREDCVRFGSRERNVVVGMSWPPSQDEIAAAIEKAEGVRE